MSDARTPDRLWLAPLAVVAILVVMQATNATFFCGFDCQLEYAPGFAEVGRAWARGEVPLVAPDNWYGGDLAAEYQLGALSPPLALTFALLDWIGPLAPSSSTFLLALVYGSVLAGGAARLARSFGLGPELAVLVAVTSALNGWMVTWALYQWTPAFTSFAFLPWAWLALRKALEDATQRRLAVLAVLELFVLTAGWPHTVLMALLVAAASLVSARENRMRVVGALLLGAAPALPQLGLMVDLLRAGTRATSGDVAFHVPVTALTGMFNPNALAGWHGAFGQLTERGSPELSGCIVAVTALAVAAARRVDLSTARPLLALLAIALVLAMLPAPGPLRFSFRWLALFHLTLVLAGGVALAALEARRAAWTADALGAVLVLAACALSWADPAKRPVPDATPVLVAAALALSAWLAWRGRAWAHAARVLPTAVLAVGFVRGHGAASVPRWSLDGLYDRASSLEARRLYFSVYTFPDLMASSSALLARVGGNLGMLLERRTVGGYSPFRPEGLTRVFGMGVLGDLETPDAEERLSGYVGPHGVLALMGVDALLVDPADPLAAKLSTAGWTARADGTFVRELGSSGVVLPDHLTWVASEDELWARLEADAPVVAVSEERRSDLRLDPQSPVAIRATRNRVEVDLPASATAPQLLVFQRAWYPGYTARVGGVDHPVLVVNGLQPGVLLEPGEGGVVSLRFLPQSLRMGAAAGALTFLLGLVAIRFASRSGPR